MGRITANAILNGTHDKIKVPFRLTLRQSLSKTVSNTIINIFLGSGNFNLRNMNLIYRRAGFYLIGLFFISQNLISQSISDINIIPKPINTTVYEGYFEITNTPLIYISPKVALNKDYLNDVMQEAGMQPRYMLKKKDTQLSFILEKSKTHNREAYDLHITPGKNGSAIIKASTKEGLLNGLQTFRQLVQKKDEKIVVPACIIKDAPKFSWRSFMLDESRHFHGTDVVKKLLNEMARLKFNIFHWHLVDDPGWRIEIKQYPKLTDIGSKRDYSHQNILPEKWDSLYPNKKMYYTQDEIKDIVRYAHDRGIKIIPELEVPGHASASIFAYPWLGSSSKIQNKPTYGDLYNVIDSNTMQFLYNVLDEITGLFPSKIIHIGGDEANYEHWKNSPTIVNFMKQKNLPTFSDLQVWAINHISKYLQSKDIKMIGWNEITGDNIRREAHIQASLSEKLAPGTIIQFWDGDISLVNKAIEKGYDVVNSNRFYTYLDYDYKTTPLEKIYSFNPIPTGFRAEDEGKILGLGCQMWGEFTPSADRLYYQIFPRIAALSECGWTPIMNKNYADFRKRMKSMETIWKKKGYLKAENY